MKPEYDCIVIGGGISGISFAHFLNKTGKKVLVVEKTERAGGQIQTGFGHDSGFWCELGAHTCYNKYASLLSIVQDLNLSDMIQPMGENPHSKEQSYLLYEEGKLKKIMSGVNIPSLLWHCWKLFFTSKEEKSVKEYYTQVLGEKNYNRLFSKAFRAVICQNADEYPIERFLKTRKTRMEEFPRKFSFKNGISSLVEAIIQKNNLPVKTGCNVTGIALHSTGGQSVYEIITDTGQSLYASSVALAADPQTASRLLENLQPSLSAYLATVPLSFSESLSVMVEKSKLSIPRLAGVIPLNDDFLSVVSRDLVDHPQFRGFTFHFEKGRKSDAEKMDIVCDVLQIKKEDIFAQEITTHVLPSLRVAHMDIIERTAQELNNTSIYLLGNYFTGVSLEDCVNRSSEESLRFHKVHIQEQAHPLLNSFYSG